MSLSGRCDDCALSTPVVVERRDPAAVLARLPEALVNQAAPAVPFVPPLRGGDIVTDTTIFGPLGGDDETPQYQICRNIAQEVDAFVLGWRQAEADQLGLGALRLLDDGVHGEDPRAVGFDLEVLYEQFGVGRPMGFTDCCYARLFGLLLFQRGSTLWRLKEIAELYTGVRPMAAEGLARVTLSWPVPSALSGSGATFLDLRGAMGSTAFLVGDAADQPTAADAVLTDGTNDAAVTYLAVPTAPVAVGLTLEQALARVKPAGCFVELHNTPLPGRTGCLGATLRTGPTGHRGRLANG